MVRRFNHDLIIESRALVKGPGVGFRKARTKLSKGWDGDPQRLEALLTRPPSSPIYVAAVHVAPSAEINARRSPSTSSARGL